MGAGMSRSSFVVEQLSIGAWLTLIPHLVNRDGVSAIRHADSTKVGRALGSLAARLFDVSVEPLVFEIYSLDDAQGFRILSRVALDFPEFREQVVRRPSFQRAAGTDSGPRWPFYLAKRVTLKSSGEPPVGRALILIRVAMTLAHADGTPATVLYSGRAWSAAISALVSGLGVRAVSVGAPKSDIKDRILDIFGARSLRLRSLQRRVGMFLTARGRRFAPPLQAAPHPVLAVLHYGQLNLDHPELHSDLAFLQCSDGLTSSDVRLLLHLPSDPVDSVGADELSRHGVQAIALDPRADLSGTVPVFYQTGRSGSSSYTTPLLDGIGDARERRWLRRQAAKYSAQVGYWEALFERSGARLFLSWYKFSSDHMAIADALQSLGGAVVIYQRSVEKALHSVGSMAADVFLAHAPAHALVEMGARSEIPYHIAVGYVGDHRFPLLQADAAAMRAELAAAGAKHVVVFFDENSTDDARWAIGHREMREDYELILNKVIEDPTIGVILKPKVPATLRHRLGEVSDLLDRAVATGRCLNLGTGPLHSPVPPAAAALAADVAYGYAFGATAVFESALAGVPSLLINTGKFPLGTLSRLPEGRVVFHSWDDMWAACVEHWDSGARTDLGQWGDVLDSLDPFQDGLAARRMGDYLAWLLDGLRAGLPRETVLADAAERYASEWGSDKVTKVTQGDWPRAF